MADEDMSSKGALVFDLDGTLIDSRRDIAAAVNFALGQLGRTALSLGTICSFVGNGAPYLLNRVAATQTEHPFSDEESSRLTEHFHSYYREHPVEFSTVLPGAGECLSLAGWRIALCTNKPRPLTDLVLEGLGWGASFQAVIGGGDTSHKKPHPEPLYRIAAELGLVSEQLVMVGDGPQDVGAARAAGAHAIGVRGGFLDESLLEDSEPNVILSSLLDLPDYLARTFV